MKQTIRYIITGMRDLPGYGPHPDEGFFVILILAAAVIGIVQGGIKSAVVGVVGAALIYGSWYLFKAYLRGRDYLEQQ